MSDTDSAEAGQHSRLAIDRRRPPPLISRDTTQFAQPAVLPVANQQLPPGYLVVPQGGPQIFQGPDGTLYAIHPPGSIQGAVQVKSPIEAAIQNSRTSPPLGTITSSALANDSSQHLPLVPIFAPIQVAPSVAKKYQQMFQLPSTSRTERVVTSPHASPRQVSPLEINAPTQVRYTGTSSLSGESLQSHVVVSPHSIYSTVQGETPSLTSSEKNPRVLLSPANYHVQSPTVNSFMEGLSTVQRASILQQHRRSLHIHEKETQEFVVEGDSSGTSSTSSRYTNLMQKDTKTESSSLKKLLQSEPESEMILSSSSASHRSESCNNTTLTLLKNEPYLVRFYQFFQSSEQSKHLRMRVLTTEGSASILKWIEVTRKASHIDPNLGPLDAVRILISSNGLCKLQVLFPYCKTLFTRFMPSSLVQANELFIELSPRHVLCPGIPDCESKISALGYQPGSVRMIETPSVRRFDHEKCPLWHIPLPCNLYSESGQIMHHMCRQCKNLYNTLTRTVAKMSQFATTEHLSTGSSGMSFAHGSTKEGRLKPSKEKRQKRMASHGSTAADVSDSAINHPTQQEGEVGSQNVRKFYTEYSTSENSETTTTRYEDRSKNTTVESPVLVISENSSSSMRLKSAGMITAPPHLLIDSDASIEISKCHSEEQTRRHAGESGDEEITETLSEKRKEKMSLETRPERLEFMFPQKHKQVATDSMLYGTVKKRKIYSSKSELQSDCSDSESDQYV